MHTNADTLSLVHSVRLKEGLKDGNIPPFSGLMLDHKKHLNCDII